MGLMIGKAIAREPLSHLTTEEREAVIALYAKGSCDPYQEMIPDPENEGDFILNPVTIDEYFTDDLERHIQVVCKGQITDEVNADAESSKASRKSEISKIRKNEN